MQPNKCHECGSENIGYNLTQGEVHCKNCGLILEESRPEAGYIDEATKRSATTPYLARAGSKGIQGKIFKDSWVLSTKEKNLRFGNSKINSLAGRLNLPPYVLSEAKTILTKSMNQNLAIGRDKLSIIFASVYAACLIHEVPKIALEIVINSSVSKKQLLRSYKLIKKKLKLNISPMDPLDLIPRFASKLNLQPSTVTLANELLLNIKDTNIVYGRRPETIVAAVLYVASIKNDDARTQRDVANAIGVIEVTIRKHAKDILAKIS